MPVSRRTWLCFTVLCVISGSSWLLDEWRPSELSSPRQLFIDNLLLALLFAAAATSRSSWPIVRHGWLRLVAFGLLGVLILALPALLVPGSGVSSTTSALIFLSIPAVVVFADSQGLQAFGHDRSPFRLLVPALAGLTGGGLILPFTWPAEPFAQRNVLLLVIAAVTAGLALVRMYRLMASGAGDRMRVLPALSFLCCFSALAASVLVFPGGVSGAWNGRAIELELMRCAAYNLPVLLLTGWLLRELRPPVFAARTFFIVSITLLESYALLRPQLSWSSIAGTLLLIGGGIGLLREDSPEISFTPSRGTVDS